MASPATTSNRDAFEVAIFCALPHEAAAVRALFDGGLDISVGKDQRDPNAYTAGVIDGHNVILVHLAQMGNNAAAVAAQACRQSFPNLRLALVVGVCGGVPKPQIFLGDVIISDSVQQFDFGRQYGDRLIPKNDTASTLARPNLEIRALLNKLRTWDVTQQLRNDLVEHLDFLSSRPGLSAHYPGEWADLLFRPDYIHKHQRLGCETCEQAVGAGSVCDGARLSTCVELGCDITNTMARQRPVTDTASTQFPNFRIPYIHFGPVASGDSVIKSGQYRDMISQEKGVIAFEMEGAGIWDIFPCLIIKSVCDYADSHKSKQWQHYAAATAAACTKAFLSRWELRARPVSQAVHGNTQASPSQNDIRSLSQDQQKEMMSILRFQRMDARILTLGNPHTATCRWITGTTVYKSWTTAENLREHHGFFWIKGKPGTGKSIMMKYLVGEARRTMRGSLILPFFFNARGGDLEKSTLGLYRSLLWQLLDKAPETRVALEAHEGSIYHVVKESGWQIEYLRDVLTIAVQAINHKKRVVCFVDALDECPEDEIRTMVSFFEELGRLEKSAQLRICFSSRHYPEINIRTGLQITLELIPSHTDDISLYIDNTLKIGENDTDDIKSELIRKSSAIFLWVALVIPMLNKAYDKGRFKALKKKLHELPSGLHELFDDMLTRDDDNKQELLSCIRLVLFAARPLTPSELLSGIDIEVEYEWALPQAGAASDDLEMSRKRVVDISKGLAEITISDKPTVQFIHESVRDFLFGAGVLQRIFDMEGGLEFRAQAHERIKELCHLHLQSNYACSYSQCEPGKSHSCYSLKEYAVDHILHHANSAQEYGISQSTWLISSFDPGIWFDARAVRKRGWKSKDADVLLYFLAEDGHAALIRLFPNLAAHLQAPVIPGQFKWPIVAALFAGQIQAAYALLGLPSPTNDSPHCQQADSAKCRRKLTRSDCNRFNGPFSYICKFGDPILLQGALDLGLEITSYEVKRCIEAAPSEQVALMLAQRGFFSAHLDPVLETYKIPPSLDLSEKALCDHIAKMKFIYPGSGSPLGWAASKGFETLVKALSERSDDEKKHAAIIRAASSSINQFGRCSVIKYLLGSGCRLSLSHEEWLFALKEAMFFPNNEEMFKFLLTTATAHQPAFASSLRSVLLFLAIFNSRKTHVQILLESGDGWSVINWDDEIVRHCIELDDYSSLRLLGKCAGFDVNHVDSLGRTALSWCASVANDTSLRIMKALITRFRDMIDPNIVDKSGQTAIIRAVRSGNTDIVEALLTIPGIDLARGKCGGYSALQAAVRLCRWNSYRTYWTICRLLLMTGKVDPDARWGCKGSAMALARKYDLVALVSLMETYKAHRGNPQHLESLKWDRDDIPFPHLEVIRMRWMARRVN